MPTVLHQLLAALVLAQVLLAGASASASTHGPGPEPGQIKNLVTFGDSYTDIDGHLDGGTVWPVYAAAYGNLTLFPFAKVGATCSNALTPRPFPSLTEAQLPAYFAARANGSLGELRPEETVYTLWIGTNDVGANALLTGGQVPGVTLVDTVTCAVNWMIPLESVPLYAPGSYPNLYWNARRNTTEWSVFMRELTTSGNALARLQLRLLAGSLQGAHIGLFDSHALFVDMYARPALYLNGTGPFNVTGAAHACVFAENESQHDSGACTDAADPDSYLWYDELHPSEQASRVVAKAISDAIHRRSERWITWLS